MLRTAMTASVRRTVGSMPRAFSTAAPNVDPANGPFVHYRQRNGENPKFKSPRKRASKLFHEINKEATEQMKQAKPAVFDAEVEVGDSVELQIITEGGVASTKPSDVEKVRGVVIGKSNRGLATSIHIRDVVYGEPVERKIHIYSPLVKTMTVLEKNFVYKGKRKVKRAKLYFLRGRNPTEYRVTKWK